jgi:hypothetical protein
LNNESRGLKVRKSSGGGYTDLTMNRHLNNEEQNGKQVMLRKGCWEEREGKQRGLKRVNMVDVLSI